MHCLVQVIRSLLQNEQIALDNYLQQIIPVLLTCIVAKQLGNVAEDDHWSVRDLAATAMSLLLEKFGEAYPELLSRVSSQLLRGLLDPTKPLTTHYGTAPSVSSGYWMRVCFLTTNQGRSLPSEPFTCVPKAGKAAAAARRHMLRLQDAFSCKCDGKARPHATPFREVRRLCFYKPMF